MLGACSDFSGNYDSKGSIIIVRAGALKDLPQLVTIDLNNNDITLIEANAFSNLPRLTKLDVSGNAITVVDANAFSNLPQLAMLKGDASFWQTAGPVGKCAQASSQTQTAAFTLWCNQGCDTSGTVVEALEGVERSCSDDNPVLCCNGRCGEQTWIMGSTNDCDKWSSRCAAAAVAVKCKPECDWLGRGSNGDGDYCQEVALTEVPTFVNKDVTDM